MPAQISPQMIGIVVTAVIGIISFFLKRTIDDVDACRADIDSMKEKYVTKEAIDKFQDDVSGKLDTIQEDLKEVQINYIPKEDFFKEMTKFDQKMDRILNLIIDNMKGEKKE